MQVHVPFCLLNRTNMRLVYRVVPIEDAIEDSTDAEQAVRSVPGSISFQMRFCVICSGKQPC